MGFRKHGKYYVEGKRYNYDSNLAPEINSFSRDGRISKRENAVLNKILKYNEAKNKEKLVLRRTTRGKLEKLKHMSGLRRYVKRRIDRILNLSNSHSRVEYRRRNRERITGIRRRVSERVSLREVREHRKMFEKLKRIYNSNSPRDRLILNTIRRLSTRRRFKYKVGMFLIKAYQLYGRKIYQANGSWGGVRSLALQRKIMRMGKGATKVKNPASSFHTFGEAIDLNVRKNDFKIFRLAAKYGLWNGAEMWNGFDHVHFQSTYSGRRSRKRAALRKMRRRGTLPRIA